MPITEDAAARHKLAKELYLKGATLKEIAEHPDIQRSIPLIHRWKVRDNWDNVVAEKVALRTGRGVIVKPSTKRELEKILDSAELDLDSSESLSERDYEKVLTALVKSLFKRALIDLEEGRVVYKNPTQLHGLIEMVMREHHLSRGEPTEIHEKRMILPDDDMAALKEGLSRLKQVASRRRDFIEAELVLPEAETVE